MAVSATQPGTVAADRIESERELAPLTWFRVGGPAEYFYTPSSPDELAAFLSRLPDAMPVTTLGVGSNLLVRDGGVRGVVLRLGKGFGTLEVLDDARIRVGAFVPAARCAAAAADAGIGGLEFLRGIPGSIGGVLAMNAGCYGTATAEVLECAIAIDRSGRMVELGVADMGFGYRTCAAARDRIFVGAVLRGTPAAADEVHERMRSLMAEREATQPIRERTGGSTFRNPGGRPGAGSATGAARESAWRLIDAAGCRGLRRGGAEVSTRHANFLINRGQATAADLEELGEEVRARVLAHSGVALEWEIHRIGERFPARVTAERNVV